MNELIEMENGRRKVARKQWERMRWTLIKEK